MAPLFLSMVNSSAHRSFLPHTKPTAPSAAVSLTSQRVLRPPATDGRKRREIAVRAGEAFDVVGGGFVDVDPTARESEFAGTQDHSAEGGIQRARSFRLGSRQKAGTAAGVLVDGGQQLVCIFHEHRFQRVDGHAGAAAAGLADFFCRFRDVRRRGLLLGF
jgi:hypothetical protein